MVVTVPSGVAAMAARGPDWSAWVDGLAVTVDDLFSRWDLRADGAPTNGHCSLVLPVRSADDVAAVLKIGFPDEESEHEHLALRSWHGDGAVRLLAAEPRVRALLLERLGPGDLCGVPDLQACAGVAGLYSRLHRPALARLRPLSAFVEQSTAQLAGLPRSAPIPRRLVEQAVTLGRELAADGAVADRVLHTDLHYANVLAGVREPWLVIDPKPVNGDPHYEIAPMLWNRWEEMAGDVRARVRARLSVLVEVAGFDAERARAWVVVRMMHNAASALTEGADPTWLTTCVAVAKAVQD